MAHFIAWQCFIKTRINILDEATDEVYLESTEDG